MGCDSPGAGVRTPQRISIHASRMGCDRLCPSKAFPWWNFNPRIPYGMRHHLRLLPVSLRDFNPRIPYGMRQHGCALTSVASYFNPRIPYGMRRQGWSALYSFNVFQSTHPVWDATGLRGQVFDAGDISIHASRMGCDDAQPVEQPITKYFNPRIPYGMRPYLDRHYAKYGEISIHASRMGCDRLCHESLPGLQISIHASRMGCDTCALPLTASCKRFQSTHPVWDATRRAPSHAQYARFQSTHPVWDATIQADTTPVNRGISIHASRMGCDIALIAWHRVPRISIHASRMGCDAPRFGSAVSAGISIHASRMGCDSTNIRTHSSIVYFNPRIPYGMRR